VRPISSSLARCDNRWVDADASERFDLVLGGRRDGGKGVPWYTLAAEQRDTQPSRSSSVKTSGRCGSDYAPDAAWYFATRSAGTRPRSLMS
jgi:hypothetical protein